MTDPTALRRQAEVWRSGRSWSSGTRREWRWEDCPADVRYGSGLFCPWSNYQYRHPFLYWSGMWVFVFVVGMFTMPLVLLAPLLAAWHAFRTPGFVRVGARAEWARTGDSGARSLTRRNES